MKMFSGKWKASSKQSKQRKYRYNAPKHIRLGFVSAHLSSELMKKFGRRSFQLRKGDAVTVMRGDNRGKAGKIERVDSKRLKVFVSGIESAKKDGTKVLLPVDPSNLLITQLELDDKERLKSIRKGVV